MALEQAAKFEVAEGNGGEVDGDAGPAQVRDQRLEHQLMADQAGAGEMA